MVADAPVKTSLPERILKLVRGEVQRDEPLAPKTSVRVGGAAELYVRPRNLKDVVELVKLCHAEGLPLTVLGGGANTLVGDGGVPGVTLKLPSDLFPEEVVAKEGGGGAATLGAGAAIARLVLQMRAHSWVGAEALAGIPGTLGGAVRMNAGTKNGECMATVQAVEVVTHEGVGWLPRAALTARYRHTELPAGGVVTRVRFELREGDAQASRQAMDADLSYRKRTQPLSQPNFGSVFQNPPGDHAGRLLEAAGLKGHTVGRAQISPRHANWIVNLGGATAKDVVTLMELMQRRVLETAGVALKPEVQRVGVFL